MQFDYRKATFPHLGNYYIAFEPIVKIVAKEIITPPPITKKTLEIGSKHSPESACVPFKYNLGNYIESLEKGANTIFQAGGGCRYGFYGEVQEEILKNLGYKFEFIKLGSKRNIISEMIFLKNLNPQNNYLKVIKTLMLGYQRTVAIDLIENEIRKKIGFEKIKGEHERIDNQFLYELKNTKNVKDVKKCKLKYLKLIKKIEIDKPENPLRVAIVGEFYVVMEPFSNFFIEKELGKRGVEIHRPMTLTSYVHHVFTSLRKHRKKLLDYAYPYLKYEIGAHGTESVGLAHKFIHSGFDGVIHVKPFGCMPEVNAMSALHKISKDYKVPIIYFSFDSLTSETGIKTRIEAFHDMLVMKRNKQFNPNQYEPRAN